MAGPSRNVRARALEKCPSLLGGSVDSRERCERPSADRAGPGLERQGCNGTGSGPLQTVSTLTNERESCDRRVVIGEL